MSNENIGRWLILLLIGVTLAFCSTACDCTVALGAGGMLMSFGCGQHIAIYSRSCIGTGGVCCILLHGIRGLTMLQWAISIARIAGMNDRFAPQ